MSRPHVSVPRQQLADFCRRWKVTELSFFGSVMRDDFRPDSDVDVLVTFAPNADWSLPRRRTRGSAFDPSDVESPGAFSPRKTMKLGERLSTLVGHGCMKSRPA